MGNSLIKNKRFFPGKDWIWYAPNTFDTFGSKEIGAVKKSLQSGWLTTGKITSEFENKIAKLFGKKYGLFVNSGSSANLVALAALHFPKGAEVITPACNFNTTVSPIVQLGLVPVFVDVNVGEYVAEVSQIEKAISKKTVAVMIPHLIGNFVDLPEIRRICKENNLIFIEDSCDTIGGAFRGKPSGVWSDITTTSFYASHIITAGGAGGMVMTNNKKLREKMRIIRDWGRGISKHDDKIRSRLSTFKINGRPYDSAFVFIELGYNFRPTEMQAAFGLEQLNRLNQFVETRRKNFKKLFTFFSRFDNFFVLPKERDFTKTNWLALPLTIKNRVPFSRETLVKYLEDHKIQTRPLFSGNILKQPAYNKIAFRKVGDLKNSQLILKNSFLIGLHHGLTDQMISYIEKVFENFLKKYI